MVCPNCHQPIAWYKVRGISRWTNLRCQTCQHEWNRNLDLQLWLIFFVGMLGVIAPACFCIIFHSGDPLWFLLRTPLWVLLWCVWSPCMNYLDAKTIKLVPSVTKKTA